MSYWLLLLLLFSGLLCLLAGHLKASRRGNKELSRRPPGPRGLLIIGNLHMIGALPHRDLARLAAQHGPIMSLRLGAVPTVVVSSPSAAEQVLRTHDAVFANRPQSDIFAYMTYSLKSFAYTEYGPQWRALRKLCVVGLLSSARLESSRAVRAEELRRLVEALREAAAARAPVNLSSMLCTLMGDVVCRMVFGRRFMEERVEGVTFGEHFEETMRLLGAFDLTGCMPVMASLDLQGLRRRARRLREVLDRFLDPVIDEHLEGKEGGREPDFIDFLLAKMDSHEEEFKIDRNHVKAVVMDMLEGALDTPPIAVEWAFSELLRHPKVMKKIQEELENVVGSHRVVEESDLPKLNYLGMVVKETLRLHPLSPLLFHYNKEECIVNGFQISAGSNVFVNIWAIGRDPNAWPNPDQFLPERFGSKDIDVRGLDFSFLPFGSGRRICPGLQLGHTMILLMLARLLQCFDWELPYGMSPSELDMAEKYCLTVRRAKPLCVIPSHVHKA